jgi:hypothetical protein
MIRNYFSPRPSTMLPIVEIMNDEKMLLLIVPGAS